MRSVIILLGAICSLTLADEPLRCIKCFQKNSDSCDGPSVPCGKNATGCLTLHELYDVDNDTYHSVEKNCNVQYPCGQTMYASNFLDACLQAHIECCDANNCNTFNYSMPSDDGKRKGGFCPGCFSKSLTECANKRTIQCKEKDDQCYHYIGTVRDPGGNEMNATFRGCLSKAGCALGFGAMRGVEELNTQTFDCTEPKATKEDYI
ncbi:phospholipase A2 inhibitor and Ly6/PLAUR domain-containing protein-like [Leptodactylus fuscus]|uniref:phospholipase A2 inhibitor and Ly6/PLAUR domain-containing protein-like n=1 Tax=Leptodactylus fuscus TaxID=238119 RepID=UPI003F4E9110